jgi:excisionase family DNA binding protein
LAAPAHLLTVPEVAEILGVSTGWVYANKARIGYSRIGGSVRFEPAAVQVYIEVSRCVSASAADSTGAPVRPSGGRSTRHRAAVLPSDSPQVAATMGRLARGLRPAKSSG